MHLKNPFADYGGIVIGDRFIGRKTEIEAIQNRLLGTNYGNIAIMGLPRIGKSSLSWNAIMNNRSDLEKQNIIPIWVSFGEYNSIIEVFQDVFNELLERVSSKDDLLLDITGFYDKFNDSKSELENRRYIKKILKFLKAKGFRLVLIFDEFDNAKNILNLSDFQFLRELSNNPETKLALLTISRKTLQELEPEK